MAINLAFWRRKDTAVDVPMPQISNLSYMDLERARGYKKYWDFYLNKQFQYKRQPGQTQVILNYLAALVDKSITFLFGNTFRLDTQNEEVETVLEQVWKDNNKGLKGIEIGQMGSVTGDCWIKPIFDEELQQLRIMVLNSSYVFPEFDPQDYSKIRKLNIVYPIGKAEDLKFYKEIITPELIQEFEGNDEIADKRRENILGEIGVVHISNLPIAGQFWGKSDMADTIDLQLEFNEKVTDVSQTINYHGSPITLIFGAKAKQLIKGAQRVWSGLPKDARVENLAGVGDLPASLQYLQILKEAFHELMGIPESALGKFQPVSNTSSTAMHMQYLPLMEKTNVKRLTYGEGLKEVNRLILKILSIKMPEVLKDIPVIQVPVIFAEPLPKDKLIERQIIAQDMSLGIESKEGALRRLGKTNDEIVETLTQVQEDQANQLAQMYAANPAEADSQMGAGGEPANPAASPAKKKVKKVNSRMVSQEDMK